MKSFKILGLLLNYPQRQLYEASGDVLDSLRKEGLLRDKMLRCIEQFLHSQAGKELLEVEEDYVETFDRGRSCCLHLFEHIHGESRDRGQALADLSEAYRAKGLYIRNNELPDYLPLFMEYLSFCSPQEASALLGEAIDIIATIGARLKKRHSPYAVVFDAIETLSAVRAEQSRVRKALETSPQDPRTLEELDQQWRETEAFGGDPIADVAADCGNCNAFAKNTRQWDKGLGGI